MACGVVVGNNVINWNGFMRKRTKKEPREIIQEFMFDMIFDSYPKDMENFNTMTKDQAYRLVKNLWEKVEKLHK